MKKVDRKKKAEAVKDYLSSGQSLIVVAARHGISVETLRKAVGPSRMRKRGKNVITRVPSVVQAALFPSLASGGNTNRKRKIKDLSSENANKRWNKTEVALLIDSVRDGLTVSETAKLLGRSNTAVIQRKSILITKGVMKDPTRFPVPDGIKRIRKQMDIPELVENDLPVVDLMPLDNTASSSSLKMIGLEDLADLVKRFGLDVTITISGDVTTVHMQS
jgi:transposase-like protein